MLSTTSSEPHHRDRHRHCHQGGQHVKFSAGNGNFLPFIQQHWAAYEYIRIFGKSRILSVERGDGFKLQNDHNQINDADDDYTHNHVDRDHQQKL